MIFSKAGWPAVDEEVRSCRGPKPRGLLAVPADGFGQGRVIQICLEPLQIETDLGGPGAQVLVGHGAPVGEQQIPVLPVFSLTLSGQGGDGGLGISQRIVLHHVPDLVGKGLQDLVDGRLATGAIAALEGGELHQGHWCVLGSAGGGSSHVQLDPGDGGFRLLGLDRGLGRGLGLGGRTRRLTFGRLGVGLAGQGSQHDSGSYGGPQEDHGKQPADPVGGILVGHIALGHKTPLETLPLSIANRNPRMKISASAGPTAGSPPDLRARTRGA